MDEEDSLLGKDRKDSITQLAGLTSGERGHTRLGLVTHIFKPNTQEAEEGDL